MEQQKLFNIKPIRVKRPNDLSIDLESVYQRLAEFFHEWDSSYTIEEAKELLEDTFDRYDLRNKNGYELCKTLDRECHVEPDLDLVEYMDCAGHEIRMAVRDSEKQWVKDCEIEPRKNLGDIVEVKIKDTVYEGEIIKVDTDYAKYLVFIEDLGHVKSGSGTIGRTFNFEDVEEDFYKVEEND
jgi:hypothetical protein